MAPTITQLTSPRAGRDVFGLHRAWIGTFTFDSSYPIGGEALTKDDFGFADGVSAVLPTADNADGAGYSYETATSKLRYLAKSPEANTTVTVKDDDNAATAGVQVYVVVDDVEAQLAHLEFVSPTNASGTFTLADGATVSVRDDDNAATNGVALQCDEDNANGDVLFASLASEGDGRDVYVQDTRGRYFRVAHATSGGVSVYFDEDGATATQRLLFVSPTNANATAPLDAEPAGGTDLSDVTVRLLALGV